MVVNIFGENTSSKGKDGKPGPPGHAAVLKEVIQWFPEFVLEELRSRINALTFKISLNKLVVAKLFNQSWGRGFPSIKSACDSVGLTLRRG